MLYKYRHKGTAFRPVIAHIPAPGSRASVIVGCTMACYKTHTSPAAYTTHPPQPRFIAQ